MNIVYMRVNGADGCGKFAIAAKFAPWHLPHSDGRAPRLRGRAPDGERILVIPRAAALLLPWPFGPHAAG